MSNFPIYENPDIVLDTDPRYDLGTLMDYTDPTYGPRKYMYVKCTDAIAYGAYQPLSWSATEGDQDHVVTNDVSEDNGCAAGVCPNQTITTGKYFWMCVQGVTPLKMNTDDDAADGDVAIIGSGDGAANTGADSGILLALGVVVTAVVAATDISVVRLRGLI